MYKNNSLNIIVLAGGFGTRIKNIIGNAPKILAPINNKKFLDYFLNWVNPLLNLDNTNLIFSLFYQSDLVVEHLDKKGVDFFCCFDKKPYGTFGAVCNAALQYPAENYLILNGDTIFKCNFIDLYSKFLLFEEKPFLILKEREKNIRYGGYLNTKDGWIFSKKNSNAISMGAYFIKHEEIIRRWELSTQLEFNSQILHNEIKYNLMNDEHCLAVEPVNGFLIPGKDFFIDIGIESSYKKAQKLIPSFF